jgi:two-component system phosphate regulon sensor histidine kinase PhoR
MLRSSFTWKLLGGMVVIVLGATTAHWALATRTITHNGVRDAQDELGRALLLLAPRVGPWLVADDHALPAAEARTIAGVLGARLTLIAADGRVRIDTEADPAATDNHRTRPEILAALAGPDPGFSDRSSTTTGKRTVYAALALREGEAVRGFLRLGRALTLVDERLTNLRSQVLLAALAGLVLAVVLSFTYAYRLGRPLRAMTGIAEGIAGGAPAHRLPVRTRDEIGTLAAALNRMADQLRERLDTIQRDRNKLVAILAGMSEGVIAIDADERVLHLNEVASRALELGEKATLGRRIWEIARQQPICELLRAVMREGRAHNEELTVAERGQDRSLELKAAPLRDGRDAIVGAVLVLHDVTQLRRLEAVRREFVANVSHELKTPLAAVRGLVETMLDDAAMPTETRQRFLARVSSQVQRLSAIVNDLLTLSRVESGPDAVDHLTLDLRRPVRESTQALLAAAQQKGHRLATEVPPEAVLVRGDEEALRQVVDNLVGNAIQYTPPGGSISVRLAADPREATIAVADTGIGIEPRDQERIFERFYRVDKARSRELGGTGLGLSIVKHIVLAHRGQVAVESQPGEGSTFRVRLPLERAEDAGNRSDAT